MTLSLKGKRVLVTGGRGFLGRHVCERLRCCAPALILAPSRDQCDLLHQDVVIRYFAVHRPDLVIHLAATVGGIGTNIKNPGRFCFENLLMGLHVVEEARRAGVEKVVVVGTTCSYPRDAPVPLREGSLWDGYPEPTNASYGVAKRTLLELLWAYRNQYGLASAYLVPANLYGPGDSFDLETCHVIPALIRRFLEAKEQGKETVTLWGDGTPTREFLFVKDAAEAVVRAALRCNQPWPINLGTGQEITIGSLAGTLADLCGYRGTICWDTSRPNGQLRRCLDTSRAEFALDWRATTPLADGLRETIAWYRKEQEQRLAEVLSNF
jgi:GDP-L-fucose synthase